MRLIKQSLLLCEVLATCGTSYVARADRKGVITPLNSAPKQSPDRKGGVSAPVQTKITEKQKNLGKNGKIHEKTDKFFKKSACKSQGSDYN